MCDSRNYDQIDSAVMLPAQPTEPAVAATEVRSTDDAPSTFDDLVETEILSSGEPIHCRPSYEAKPECRDQRDPLPRWAYVDIGTVLPDPAIELALRAAGIDRIHRPSTGFLDEEGILRLAMIQPIHLIRRDNTWFCILNWDLVREAQGILHAPRKLPVCVRLDITLEELQEYLTIEQIALSLRHQMSPHELYSFALTFLAVVNGSLKLFKHLKAEDWARLLGKSLRWLRTHTVAADEVTDHD